MFHAWKTQTCGKCGSSLVIQSASCIISKNLSSSCKSLARIHSRLEIKPRKPPSATVVNASTGGAFSSASACVRPIRSRSRLSEFCIRATPKSSPTASRSRMNFLKRPFISVQVPGARCQVSGSPVRRLTLRTSHLAHYFSLRSLRRRQLTPVENKNSKHGKNSSKQQNNLTERQAQLRPRDAAPRTERVNRRKAFGEIDDTQRGSEKRHDPQVHH